MAGTTKINDKDGNQIDIDYPLPTYRGRTTLAYIFNEAAPAAGGIIENSTTAIIGGGDPLSVFARTPTTLEVSVSISEEGIYTYTRTRGAVPKTIRPFGVTPHSADSEARFDIMVQDGDAIDILHSAGAGTVNHLIVREV